MQTYKLINPYIHSASFVNEFPAESGLEASKLAWKRCASYFRDPVKNMPFLMEDENGYIHPFLVKEKFARKGESKVIKFRINEIKNKISSENSKQIKSSLKNNITKVSNQTGGKHHHHEKDDSSDSSSSSSTTTYPSGPILFYNPGIFSSSIFMYPRVIAPVRLGFYSPLVSPWW